MLLIDHVLGNRSEAEWRAKLGDCAIEEICFDQWEAQKNRLRKKTQSGREIALSLPRAVQLRDGDIFVYDAAAKSALIAKITLKDVMVIDLKAPQALSAQETARVCFELGHALGNQHWPAVVKEDAVYVPLTVDRKVMDAVMRTHRFEHVHYTFIPGAEVILYLAPHETRRLFGGAEATPHSHAGAAHEHTPDKHGGHEQTHDHAHS